MALPTRCGTTASEASATKGASAKAATTAVTTTAKASETATTAAWRSHIERVGQQGYHAHKSQPVVLAILVKEEDAPTSDSY